MKGKSMFVVMPIRKELENVYYVIQTIGRDLNCRAIRVDELQTTDRITDRIITHILESDLIIADVTHHNPNVFYEVGYAFALGKEVLLIAKSRENLPFDIRDYHVANYGDETNVRTLLDSLTKPIEEALQRSSKRTSLTKPLLDMVRTLSRTEPSVNLFDKLVEFRLNETAKSLVEWTTGKMSVGPKETVVKGIQIFENLKHGGFATYLAPISGYWTLNKEYLDAGRKAARDRKKLIERAYILPNYSTLFSKELINLISDDEESKIDTSVAFYHQIPAKEVIRDFGIWDNELLCLIDTVENPQGGTEVRGCSFTKNSSELSTAKYWKNEISKVSYEGKKIIDELAKADDDRRLLFTSLEIMDNYSKMYCKGSYLNEEDCSWYHTSWQYLRLLDIVSTPFWHKDFYLENIKSEITRKDSNKKILICGLADYAMLQLVHKALTEASIGEAIRPAIETLDLCRTPLEMCRWYAGKYMGDYNLNFAQKDARKTDYDEEIFDIIVTDAFLTRFNRNGRIQIVDEWARILKTDGIVVTTIRLNTSKSRRGIRCTAEDAKCYMQKAKVRLERNGVLLLPIREKIVEMAHLYSENIVSYPCENEDEIKNLFSAFDVGIEIGKTPGEMIDQTTYARVLARKK